MRVLLVAAALLLTFVAMPAEAQEVDKCWGKPGEVAACATIGEDNCAAVGLGLQGVRACYNGERARVCVGIICEDIPSN